MGKNVLVIDSGGRGHALAWKVSQSRDIGTVFVAPGNGGTAQFAQNVPLTPTNIGGLIEFATKNDIYLTVVGQDDPLAAGIVDLFQEEGLRIFGPRARAARIESSKAYSKELMESAGIPTAKARVFRGYDHAKLYLDKARLPLVVKDSGLALGKGVHMCATREEALKAVHSILVEQPPRPFQDNAVVIEDMLEGVEFSVHALSDGTHHALFPPSQDYKRIGKGDTGLNTGGMGAVAPLPWVAAETMADIDRGVVAPILRALTEDSTAFLGCLYPGIMMTSEGPKVLEFNARFGDPETQLYMMLLESDLLEVLDACVDGALGDVQLKWSKEFAACVVLASAGYPGAYNTGVEITLPTSSIPNTQLFHAGTKLDGSKLVTSGGRVFGATATGATLAEALDRAYELARAVEFEGKYFRPDIGANTLALM